jgi:hypothetical protein
MGIGKHPSLENFILASLSLTLNDVLHCWIIYDTWYKYLKNFSHPPW